jgi:hypothetical protein
VAAFLASLTQPTLLFAQEAPAPAHLSVVEGTATLERETGTEDASTGLPLVPGDRIRTAAGRVEVLFPEGSALAIDEYSVVDLQSETLIRLASGRALLHVAGARDPARAVRYQIDTPVASIANAGAGEFRVTVLTGRGELETELAVLRGTASIATEHGSVLLRAGERSLARDDASPSAPQIYNSARLDDFDRWAAARRTARLGPVGSGQYLPSDLRIYSGTLDQNGSWSYEADYGYVWYPTVSSSWRPYYYGHWRSVPHHGWTWVAHDPWGWPTHHYGRWGHRHSRWYWIPGHHYAPAWVSWASAPGYIGWGPLGFDNRAVFSLSVSIGTPWIGWSVLPTAHFGVHASYVNYYPKAPHWPAPQRFVAHNKAPIAPARAVPRFGPGSPGSPSRPIDTFAGRGGRGGAPGTVAGPGQPALADIARQANAAAGGRPTTIGRSQAGQRAIPRNAAREPVAREPLASQTNTLVTSDSRTSIWRGPSIAGARVPNSSSVRLPESPTAVGSSPRRR